MDPEGLNLPKYHFETGLSQRSGTERTAQRLLHTIRVLEEDVHKQPLALPPWFHSLSTSVLGSRIRPNNL